MDSVYDDRTLLLTDFSIRKFTDQSLYAAPRDLSQLYSLYAAPRDLSQLYTSFIAYRCQGILHALLVA